ncbi:hypothetical protein [Streptomyces sp. NPDC002994]|uniref:hypothetical protein n=1 Tax=Streptomyces sp. NPDC002994 TaxID=3154441 RepID=UPI0033B30A63
MSKWFQTVVTVAPVGAEVEVGGAAGFIDQVKHPSWWDENVAPPRIGGEIHVVVLDADREPPRMTHCNGHRDRRAAVRRSERLEPQSQGQGSG